MWWQFFLLTSFTIFCINQAVVCSTSKRNALETIRGIIQEASQRLQNHPNQDLCYSYGEEKIHQNGETDSHILLLHNVCFEDQNDLKKLYVEAITRKSDMGEHKTEKANEKAKQWLKYTYDPCKCDEAGHIIPRCLGGSGKLYNLFGQNHNLNRGKWNIICNRITTFLTATNDGRVRMRFYFIYEDAEFPSRPSGFYYSFTYSDGQQNVKEEYGYLANENHDGVNLMECEIENNQKLLYMSALSNQHISRQTCSAIHDNEEYQYGPKFNQHLTTMLSDGIKFFD